MKTKTKEQLINELVEVRKRITELEAPEAKRKQMEKRPREPERFLSKIFDSIQDPFCILDRDYKIVRTNEAYSQKKNKPVKKLIGERCYEILYERNSVCEDCVVEKAFMSGDPCAKEKRLTSPDGTEEWMEIYTYPIIDESRVVLHVIEYVRDITERKRMEEELKKLASTDRLTQAYNRLKFEEIITREIERVKRYNQLLSMAMLDIDYFKKVNDTYGHLVGDYVLKTIADIVRENIRKIDYLVRWGGEEFMIIFPETDLERTKELAERIRKVIGNYSFDKAGKVTVSFGVSQFKEGDTEDDFIKRVDDAMYKAKTNGRNRVEATS